MNATRQLFSFCFLKFTAFMAVSANFNNYIVKFENEYLFGILKEYHCCFHKKL